MNNMKNLLKFNGMNNLKFTLMVLATALLICGCKSQKRQTEICHSVEVVVPTETSDGETQQLTGIVKVQSEINLGFKTPGQIVAVYVKEGQHVSKGQLLARLDVKDYALGVKAASIQYQQLKDEIGRMAKLYQAKGISGNDYEKAVAGLQQAGVNLQSNRNKLSYTFLYAPVSGVIKSVDFEVSEMVNAGTPVFEILSSGQKEIEVDMPQNLYLQHHRFNSFYAFVNGHSYPLYLRDIIPDADNNQLFKAQFLILGNSTELIDGMNADVRIGLSDPQRSGLLSLPEHAVFQKEGTTYVWVLGNDGRVNQTEVVTGGLDADGNVIIKAGLSRQAHVVKAGVNCLQNHEKVAVIGEESATNIGNLL
jgi:RND family efflux transporter MFP subunit